MTPPAVSVNKLLSRVTSTGEFIPQIDGLRFLAMFMVVTVHLFGMYLVQTHRLGVTALPRDWPSLTAHSRLAIWVGHLAFGVQLFFVISGFVLMLPFARAFLKAAPPPSTGLYLLRRLIRLEPPYVLSLVLLFSFLILPWHQAAPLAYLHSHFRAFFPHLLASVVYLHWAIYGGASWINGIAWTLEVEVQFYLLVPLLANLFRIRSTALRRSILVLLILTTALLAQFAFPPLHSARLSLTIALQMQFFLAGLLVVDVYLIPPRVLVPGWRIADALAILTAVMLAFVVQAAPRFAWTEPFLIAGFYCGAIWGPWLSKLFSLPILTTLGGMSYTTYLYHVFLMDKMLPFTVKLFPPRHALWLDTTIQLLVIIAPLLAISAILFLATEKPFMILSRRITRRLGAKRNVESVALAPSISNSI